MYVCVCGLSACLNYPCTPSAQRYVGKPLYWVNLPATVGPPGCSMRPVNTVVQCVYMSQKFHNNLGRWAYSLLLLFHVWPANQLAVKDVALCRRKVGDP